MTSSKQVIFFSDGSQMGYLFSEHDTSRALKREFGIKGLQGKKLG